MNPPTLSDLPNKTIVVVGDIMLDHYVMGETSRISPEAPTQVVDVESEQYVLGGAGNVAAKIVELGGKAILIGFVGVDDDSVILQDLLHAQGIISRLIHITGRRTTRKMRCVSRGQQLLRLDYETLEKPFNHTWSELNGKYKLACDEADAVILQDYSKGVLTKDSLEYLLSHTTSPVLVEPKDKPIEQYSGCTAIKPNIVEAELAVGRRLKTDEDFEDAATQIKARTGADVYITRGSAGITIKNSQTHHVKTSKYNVFDTTGAGDAVAAVLALAMADQWDARCAAEAANIAGGIIVGQVGNGTLL